MTVPFLTSSEPVADTPFDLVGDTWATRVARKAVVLSLCHRLEEQANNKKDPPVLLSTFQDKQFFTAETAQVYAALARTCPLVAAFGVGLPDDVAPGVRVATLAPHDPLVAQWSIIVVGAHFASAFIARDLGDDCADADRRFEYLLTHDRDLAVAAGRCLLTRFT